MNIRTTGKCPSCGQLLLRVLGGHTIVAVIGGTDRHGIVYSCPACHTCLGVEIDPIALKKEVVSEIEDILSRKR